jgi:uncharacterized repeat protein (TIGR03806 family)
VRIVISSLLACALLGCSHPERNVVLHAADQAPAHLSEWGILMADGEQLVINEHVVPYELNAPLFSDYAFKLRTVWMPAGSIAQFDASQEFSFPVGTVISKTFYYEKAGSWSLDNDVVVIDNDPHELSPDGTLDLDKYLLLETRLLLRDVDGWHAFPYVWNAAQEDATLEIAGDVRELQLIADNATQTINYVVPDANQCAACHTPDHTAAELRPLGPKAWQLNRAYAWWGDAASQIEHWTTAGLLLGAPASVPQSVDSLEQRVKTYLDANCAHCHNPAGAADTSGLHLNIDAPLDRHYGICKPPVAVGRGSGDRSYDIHPGKPDDSIMLYRMQHSDPAIAMPELGRSAIHAQGVLMLQEWIAAMPGEC